MASENVNVEVQNANKEEEMEVNNPVKIKGIEIYKETKHPKLNAKKEVVYGGKSNERPKMRKPHLSHNDLGFSMLENPDKKIYEVDNENENDNDRLSIPNSHDSVSDRSYEDDYENAYDDEDMSEDEEHDSRSREEIEREKQDILFKLYRLEKAGLKPSHHYTLRSRLEDMKMEYERLKRQQTSDQGLKVCRKILLSVVSGVEFLNKKYDPFDIKLDNWSETVSDNMSEYDDMFIELIDKYSKSVHVAPEIRLIFTLAMSGVMCHLTNTLFKSALPNIADIAKQNPDLMNNIQMAMKESLKQKNENILPANQDPTKSQLPPPSMNLPNEIPQDIQNDLREQMFMKHNNPTPMDRPLPPRDTIVDNSPPPNLSQPPQDEDRFSEVSSYSDTSTIDVDTKNVKIEVKKRKGKAPKNVITL